MEQVPVLILLTAAVDIKVPQRLTQRAMSNMGGYKQILRANKPELQSIGWLQDIQAAGAEDSRDPRPESLPEGMSTVGWLSTSILHDLRNPAAAIYAGAEMLLNVDTTPTQVKRLALSMYRAASRMQDLLAELSCTYGNRSTTELCEIRELIAAAGEAASTAAENHSVRILLDVPCDIQLPLARSRMKRVFFNLITNALEAMPTGGQLRIGARRVGNYVLVEIEDTGPGIPHEIRESVFEPFVTAGKEHGLGLGLALARRAVLDHGGDIWIEPAAGARFVIRFPYSPK
jgi:two-component system NtrC family sensor kinase